MYLVNKEVNQARVDILLPGVLRDNPDMFPIMVMNDIFGGGGFTARLMTRVRSDEGLAYGAYSRFRGGIYYPLPCTAALQTKSRTTAYAASIVLQILFSSSTTSKRATGSPLCYLPHWADPRPGPESDRA